MKTDNLLIIKYMKIEKNLNGKYEISHLGKITSKGDWKDTFLESELAYHKDYNWLMSVYTHINKNINNYSIFLKNIWFDRNSDFKNIRECYDSVILFIKAYNKYYEQNK